MSDDLVTWLRARLDEDERLAKALQEPSFAAWNPGPWRYSIGFGPDEGIVDANGYPVIRFKHHADPTVHVVDHVLRHHPARVLAEVAAKRAILDAYAWALEHPAASTDGETGYWFRKGGQSTLSETVLLLAQPYADRPGFRDEWRVVLAE